MTDIGTLGGTESRANAINQVGRVVGTSTTASGEPHAFAWKDGKFQDLGDHDTRSGEATAINNGRIAGFFGIRHDAENSLAESPAFVFSGGMLTIIVTRQPVAQARGINPDGIVVGFDLDPRNDVNPQNPWVAPERRDGVLCPSCPTATPRRRGSTGSAPSRLQHDRDRPAPGGRSGGRQ